MICTKCGKNVQEGLGFCDVCGNPMTQEAAATAQARQQQGQPIQPTQRPPQYRQPTQDPPYQQQAQYQAQQPRSACPRCGGTNISFQAVNTAMGTRNRERGCLWTLGRATLIVCTLGLWLLIGRSKGKSNTQIRTETQAVCQGCGNRWQAY